MILRSCIHSSLVIFFLGLMACEKKSSEQVSFEESEAASSCAKLTSSQLFDSSSTGEFSRMPTSSALFGGQVVTAEDRLSQVVVLINQKDSKGALLAYCTGTLVAKDIVLTAAHCVGEVHVSHGKDLEVILRARTDSSGSGIDSSLLPLGSAEGGASGSGKSTPLRKRRGGETQVRGVSEVEISPQWGRMTEGPVVIHGDLALLKLDSAFTVQDSPFGFANALPGVSSQSESSDSGPNRLFVQASRRSFSIGDDHCFLAAGYGVTTDYQEDDDSEVLLHATVLPLLKPSTQKKVEDSIRNLLKSGSVPEGAGASGNSIDSFVKDFFKMGADFEPIYVDQTEGRGICAGDSGGPLFSLERGRLRIVGVTRAVMNFVDPTRKCKLISEYTSLGFHESWIQMTLSRWLGDDAPATRFFEDTPSIANQ